MPLNIDWQQILLHLLNFVVLFAILYFLLYDPIKKFMEKRTQYYKDIDDEAKANLQKSQSLKEEYSAKLSAVDGEIEQKRQEAFAALSEKNEKSMLAAKQEAEKIVEQARKKAEEEHNKLLENAKKEIADIAADAAEKIVGAGNTSEAYDSFLGSVKRSEADD